VGHKNEGPYSVIEDYDAEYLEQKAIQNICGFIYKYPFEPFSLEISLQLSTIRKTPEPNQRYDQMVTEEIRDKMGKKNIINQQFLPRVDRDQLTTKTTLLKILSQQLEGSSKDPEPMCTEIVSRGASTLFIACIYVGLGLDIIEHLIIKHGFNDDKLPSLPEGNAACPYGTSSCNKKVRHLLPDLNAFFARNVELDGQKHVLDDDAVMPILNIAKSDNGGKVSNSETELGQGAYGRVTAVMIAHSHHYLTGVSCASQ